VVIYDDKGMTEARNDAFVDVATAGVAQTVNDPDIDTLGDTGLPMKCWIGDLDLMGKEHYLNSGCLRSGPVLTSAPAVV
jgi:hypothetical protein